METRVTEKPEFVLLTDRWGNLNLADEEALYASDEEETSIENLLDHMHEEFTFIARRKSDGVVGILIEPAEIPHADSDDAPEDYASFWSGFTVNGVTVGADSVPTLEDAIAHLRSSADPVLESHPDMDISIIHGAEVALGRAVIRAFVPEGSPLLSEIESLTNRLLGGEPSPAPAP